MIKNNLKIAWRNLVKNKTHTIINILGLAFGMSLTLIIGLWISTEIQYDRFYSKTDRLTQVYTLDTFEGSAHTWAGSPAVLGPIMKQDHPEIEQVVRTSNIGHLLHHGEKRFKSDGIASDPEFFDLFDFTFIRGNAATALQQPDAIVLTESLAQKLFASTDIIDQIVRVDSTTTLNVQGVIKDVPFNSKFQSTEFFCSWEFLTLSGRTFSDSWTSYNYQTYALLKEGSSLSSTNENIKNLVKNHADKTVTASIHLYPANKWHLYNKSENGKMVAGHIVTLRMFALIGLFILIIACINFINLSTASAEKRAKEIGVRKVIGAPKKSLIQQFLLESFLLTLLASCVALMITTLALPAFNNLISSNINILEHLFVFWGLFLSIVGITTFGAGLYPAFVLSSFDPIKSLKGNLGLINGRLQPRKTLVTLQFVISICLGICTFIIAQQIRHAENRDSGYQQHNLVFASLDGDLPKNYEVVRQQLLQQGLASSVTKSVGITRSTSNSWGFSWPNGLPEDYDQLFTITSTDVDFTRTMGIKLKDGRDIDIYNHPADSNAILLNEAAVRRMRLTDPIGTAVTVSKGTEYEKVWTVVGVVEDFVVQSPYDEVEPVMVQGPSSWFNDIYIRLKNEENLVATIEHIQRILNTHNPNYPTDIRFADAAYNQKFQQQKRTAKLTVLFSSLAIFIASLGLFGLVSFAAVQRQKEIGIRKVLGASVANIASMLSKDFIKLVLLAILIASPLAWWIMNQWLDGFAYRIAVPWWIFVSAGALALLIAISTVSTVAIKAGNSNPLNNLRDE